METNTYPLSEGFVSVYKPQPLITVSEWAERYRILPRSGSSAPGPWRNSRTPYLVEIMDSLSPSSKAKEIVFAKGAQIGATESGLNWIMYLIDVRPGPILALQPTEDTAGRWSKQRVSPSLEQCERLAGKIIDPKTRQKGNSIFQKDYPGGTLILSGANSPAALASMPIGNIYFDEVDRYPLEAGDEGDPIDLAVQRISTYPQAKVFYTSTPTIEEVSKIWALYEDSDKRIYMLPCPHCEELHQLLFDNLHWLEGKPETAVMHCPHCGAAIEERYKTQMLRDGRWIATNPGHWRVGYHLSSLYSPVGWLSWVDVARRWEAAKNDPIKRKTFINTILGLPWREEGEEIAAKALNDRNEDYPAQVPPGVLLLTMAVDVQADRLEYEVCGWGRDEESWGIAYGVIRGDPSILRGEPEQPSVWEVLDHIRSQGWAFEDGRELRVACTTVDSGGHFTDTVYQYTRAREKLRVYAIKGGSQRDRALLSKPTRNTKNKAALWVLGVDKGKELVYARLRIAAPGAGYCHFPSDETTGYDAAYYAGLTSEKRVKRLINGRVVLKWEVPRGVRNEPLDLRVYNTAAIRILNPKWDLLERRRNDAVRPRATATQARPPQAQRRYAPRRNGVMF